MGNNKIGSHSVAASQYAQDLRKMKEGPRKREGEGGREAKASNRARSSTSSCNQPVQHGIQIRLFFGADAVAAHFTMGDRLQIHRVNQLVDRQFIRQV